MNYEKQINIYQFSYIAGRGNSLIERSSTNFLFFISAGIGRTGVLILVETALCLMENNQPVFPLNIVRQMREQRLGMIQTAVR